MGSMKAVSSEIKLYDTEVQKTLEYFKCVVTSEEISTGEHTEIFSGDSDMWQ